MVSYHPDSRFLTDFAAGALPVSEAVCVAAHLSFCGRCRAHVQQLNDLGAQLFTRLQPAAVAPESFDAVMKRIETGEGSAENLAEGLAESVPEQCSASAQDANLNTAAPDPALVAAGADREAPRRCTDGSLPSVVHKLTGGGLENLPWVQLGKSLRIAPVALGSSCRDTAIYDIKAGGQMPEHEHHGEEITVLLKGSFSDADGHYRAGDFVVRNAGEHHQPTATQDTDCICLVSLERPIRARSFWYRLLEPYVSYRLARAARRARRLLP